MRFLNKIMLVACPYVIKKRIDWHNNFLFLMIHNYLINSDVFKFRVISIDKENIWRNYPTGDLSVLIRANIIETFCASNVHICETVKIIYSSDYSFLVYNYQKEWEWQVKPDGILLGKLERMKNQSKCSVLIYEMLCCRAWQTAWLQVVLHSWKNLTLCK